MIQILLILGIVFTAEEAIVVTSQGKGIIVREDRAKARNEALADSLKNAVEKVVGTLLPKESMEEHFDLLNDKIYARPSSYIRTYRIAEEKEVGDFFTVTTEVQIVGSELEKDLAAIGVLLSRKQTPRVVVIVMEHNVTDQTFRSYLFKSSIPSEGFMAGSLKVTYSQGEPSTCETVMMDTLSERGMTVIAPSLVAQKVGGLKGVKISSLDDASAGKIAEISGADIAVYGRAVARLAPSMEGSPLIAARADISVRAVKEGPGSVIAASIGHGTTVHSIDSVSGNEALKKATIEATEDISGKILSLWGAENGRKRSISVTASGIMRYALLDRLQRMLKREIRGVKNVSLQSLTAGTAHLNVEYVGTANELAREIAKINLGDLKIVCEDISR